MNRLRLIIAALLLAAWAGSLGGAYLKGRADLAGEVKLERTVDAVDASTANLESARAVARAADSQASEINRLNLELRHAERELRRFENRAAAPGTVGASALVDPDLGRAFLCRVRRLRHEAIAATDNCPRDDADAGAAGR